MSMEIRLRTDAPEFYNDIAEMFRLVWGQDSSVYMEGHTAPAAAQADLLCVHRSGDTDYTFDNAVYCLLRSPDGGVRLLRCRSCTPYRAQAALEHKRYRKRAAKNAFFDCLRPVAPAALPWGSLTGIRPTRLLYEYLGKGYTSQQGIDGLCADFHLHPDKAQLLADIVATQREAMADAQPRDIDVYIGIPFCPSRCSYCSFAAMDINKAAKLVSPYLDALRREIACAGDIVRRQGLRLRCLYFGGGTPTALTSAQLGSLLDACADAFGDGFCEVTVEAGRPDTLTPDMVDMLGERGVTRVSVNPQTLCDETLLRIGRGHTCRDVYAAYAMVRERLRVQVNMDLILGLPGESLDTMMASLEGALALAPENITVHTLALKRASKLMEQGAAHADEGGVATAVTANEARLAAAGYAPYYLYRQKYMAGRLENVGYTLPGGACLYNIHTMEETTGVIALGAGGISKRIFDRELRIERQPNPRDVAWYLQSLESIIEKKRRFFG